MTLLELRRLSVTFGGLHAVDGVDLDVDDGTLVGLIGPNGAGKTTLIDSVTGIVASRGRILFRGDRIDRLPAHRRARRGLVRTFQSLELFDDITVRENLLVAAETLDWRTAVTAPLRFRANARSSARADEVLETLGIQDLADRLPDSLSLGERKLVTVGRALAGDPKLLLLDEPAAGLDSEASIELGGTLRRLVERGLAMLLVDHDMGLVLDVCDYVYVLEFGRVIAKGTPREVSTDQRVIEAYLGADNEYAASAT